MSTIELLPELGPMDADEASGWVAACLAEAEALRRYDRRLFPKSSAAADVEEARKVHRLWQNWLHQAEHVHQQARALRSQALIVEREEELSRAIARTRAMLQMTPERHALALEQARRGEVVEGSEVRRQLELEKARRRSGG